MAYVHTRMGVVDGALKITGELQSRDPFKVMFTALVELTALQLAVEREQSHTSPDKADVANELADVCAVLGIECPDAYCMETYGDLLQAIHEKLGDVE